MMIWDEKIALKKQRFRQKPKYGPDYGLKAKGFL